MMSEQEITEIFRRSGALMEGHFKLTSGLHSPMYVNKFKILSNPIFAAPLLKEMASFWQNKNIEIVVGPALGGIIFSYEIASHLGTEGIFLEKKNERFSLSRGFTIERSQRVLVVEDVVTTGGSVHEVCDEVRRFGGIIAGISLMVDRSGGKAKFDVEVTSLLKLDLEVYEPEACPLCEKNVELYSSGSTE